MLAALRGFDEEIRSSQCKVESELDTCERILCLYTNRTYIATFTPRSCAVTKVQELFYCPGAEAVDGTHLTVELFHQVEGALLIRMNQHTVKYQLLLRGEGTKQTFQAGDMIHGQLQPEEDSSF